jgi:hypothetical protein
MTPDDRETDLKPLGSEFGFPLAGRPLPPLSASVHARADAFAGRVFELTTMHGMVEDSAIKRAYREHDAAVKANRELPPGARWAARAFVALVCLTIGALAVPALGWVIGYLLVPLWRQAFAWL